MPPIRRVGRPGLVGLAARTAVVSGTAAAVQGKAAQRQQAAAQQQYAQAQAAAPPVDLAAELGKLATLHESGVLTDEEFAAAKARLLG